MLHYLQGLAGPLGALQIKILQHMWLWCKKKMKFCHLYVKGTQNWQIHKLDLEGEFLYFSVFCAILSFRHFFFSFAAVNDTCSLTKITFFPLCITIGYYVTLKSINYLHNKDNLRIVFEFRAIKWCRISFIKCDYVSIQKLVRQKPIYAWRTGDSVFNHVSADVLNYFLV